MDKLNLNELMRYGFAGGNFIILLVISFENNLLEIKSDFAKSALILAISLLIGSVVYAFHRALPYPLLYKLLSLLNGRSEKSIDLDIIRWKNSAKKGALQPKMREWAAQVHLLYCLAWSTGLVLLAGTTASLVRSSIWSISVGLLVIYLILAVVHHYRYLKQEKRVFEEDTKL